jgi:uncharacterized membrane protein
MAAVANKLAQWQQAGLLSAEQADAILVFEAQQTTRSPWWLYSLMILGAAIMGLGIISLIAANWSDIPDLFKLSIAFIVLGGLGMAIYQQYTPPHNGIWFEVLIIGFILMCLATIGLTAQIYHSGGHWYYAILFWAFITLPLCLFAKNGFTRFLWVSLLLHSGIWALTQWDFERDFIFTDRIPGIFLLAPLLSAVAYVASKQWKWLHPFTPSLLFWLQVSAIISLGFIDTVRSVDSLSATATLAYMPAYICAILLALGVMVSNRYNLLNKLLVLAVLGLFLIYYQPGGFFLDMFRTNLFGADNSQVAWWQANDIRAPLLSLTVLFLYAIHAGNSGQTRIFNLLTFLIGLRFLILYFQAMGGLAATGVGLILSGAFIIGIAWLWAKQREKLRQWSQELNV